MKLMVVDDSKVMRSLVRRALRQAGYGSAEVVEAESGKDALEKFPDAQPDIILSDWNMPEMNGLEFLKDIRADGYKMPFIFVTTECTDEMKAAANEAGASSFITKPFTADDVRDTLEAVAG